MISVHTSIFDAIKELSSSSILNLPEGPRAVEFSQVIQKVVLAQTQELCKENDILRGLLAKLRKSCHYCGLEDISKCKLGFPGCSLADDLMCSEDTEFCDLLARYRKSEATLKQVLERQGKERAESSNLGYPRP